MNVWKAAAIGFVVASAIILGSSGGDVDRMARSDGLIYRYVAAHLTQDPEDVDPVVKERGTSLRYGRIGLPILIWLTSAGRAEVMPYAQPILMALAAGAAAAAAVRLLPRAGPLTPLLPFIAPGFTLSVVGGYAEAVAVALGLWCLVFVREERWSAAAISLGSAILARENAAAVLVGACVWLLLRRRFRPAGVLLLSLVPVAAWYAFVSLRYGHIPPLDPYLRVQTTTIDTPFVAVARSLFDPITTRSFAVALIHLLLACIAIVLWRRSLFAAVAAAAGLQVFSAGQFSWRFIGESVRVFVFLQLMLVFLAADARSRSHEARAGATAT